MLKGRSDNDITATNKKSCPLQTYVDDKQWSSDFWHNGFFQKMGSTTSDEKKIWTEKPDAVFKKVRSCYRQALA